MKNLKTSTVLFFILIPFNLTAQNLIGSSAKDIRIYMKENQKIFANQGMVYNSTFKYLKYVDRNETQTLLFFLTTDSICRSVRLVCDKSLKDQKIKELNSNFKKTSENNWTDFKNGKKFLIELKDEELSFSVTIRPGD
jgi:hypothetical protein